VGMVIAPRQARVPPSHPAAPAIGKLRTASKKLGELSAQWNEFRAVVRVGFEPRYDAASHTVSYFAHVAPQPPLEDYAVSLRGVVADARSALDNMVYDLGVVHGVRAKDLGRNAFPALGTRDANDWARRRGEALTGLPADVVRRVQDVQPFMMVPQTGVPHPLEVLNRLSNDDKHRWGIELGLVPHVAGTHRLVTADFALPAEVAKAMLQRPLTPDDVDAVIDFDPNPVVGHRPVLALHLPDEVDIEGIKLTPLDLPLSLAIVSLTDAANLPVFPVLGNALRWAREAVRYVTGVTDAPPVPFEPGLIVGPDGDPLGRA
jgi:hypothetical protein